LERERNDRAAVEAKVCDKTRELDDLQAKFDAQCAEISARYCCLCPQ